jgi:23S rRNA (adenine1618-N6)-methyltransferase
LEKNNFEKIPTGRQIKCLDIRTGASCIYPIIGCREYGWSFIGSDIDLAAIESAKRIVFSNPSLRENIEFILQTNPNDIFHGIIGKDEMFDISICNPPFHSSAEEAQAGTLRKLRNLNPNKKIEPVLNFGGQNHELCCAGGELKFVQDMIQQSKKFGAGFFCFSTLISKVSNLKTVYRLLEQVKVFHFETIQMEHGNKTSRIVVWTFLNSEEQTKWKNSRWEKINSHRKNKKKQNKSTSCTKDYTCQIKYA